MSKIYTVIILISLFINVKLAMACGCVLPTVPTGFCDCVEYVSYDENSCERQMACGVPGPGYCNTYDQLYVGASCSMSYQVDTEEPDEKINEPSKICGSIINVENRSMNETIPVMGSGDFLTYSSERVIGRKDQLKFKQKVTVPSDPTVTKIFIKHIIFGTTIENEYDLLSDPEYTYEWNGLDLSSNELIDGVKSRVEVEYEFNGTTRTLIYKKDINFGFYNTKLLGLGGYTLSNHHFYNTKLNKLHYGDGNDKIVRAIKINLSGDVVEKLASDATSFTNYLVASANGSEAYIFNLEGYHIETRSTRTSKVLTAFSYDINKKLTLIEDAFGNETVITRPNSTTVEIEPPSGKTTTLTLNANGYATFISTPNNETYEMTYLSNGLMQTFETPKGLVSTFTYDADGNLLEDSNSAGQNVEINVIDDEPNHKLIEAVSAEGRISQYYTSLLADGESSTTTTKPTGATLSENKQDAYYLRTNPDTSSVTISRTEDARFGVQVYTDSLTYNYSHQAYHQTTQYDEFSYSETDLLKLNGHTKAVNFYGSEWTTTYDELTQTYTNTSPLSRTQSVKYNNLDQVIEMTDASFLPVVYGYDILGRLSTVTQGNRVWTYAYNPEHEIESLTNPLSQTISYVYDDNSRVTEVTYPNNQKTFLSYDEMGNLSGIKANGKPWHNFLYTLFGGILEYILPDVGSGVKNVEYAYNNDKQLTRITRENLRQINFTYDNHTALLEEIETPEGDYIYNTNSTTEQLQHIWSPNSVKVEYDYSGDALKIQRIKDQSVLDQNESQIQYDYDKMQVSKITVKHTDVNSNKSSVTALTYNSDFLLKKIGNLTLARSDVTGLITRLTLLGGINENYTYNASFGEVSIFNTRFSTTQKYKEQYVRDRLSRIIQMRQTTGTDPEVTINYLYDVRGRLSNAKLNNVIQRKYFYDANSNRTRIENATANILAQGTYNGQDQLLTYLVKDAAGTTLNSYSYTYDDFGNRLTKTDTTNNTREEYNYNSIGSLISYIKKDNTTSAVLKTITYQNDGLGRRLTKTEDGVLQTRYIYDEGIRLVGEVSPDGEILTHYIYADKSHTPAYMNRNGLNYKLVTNQQGSVRFVMLSTTGAVQQEMNYDEFGNVTVDTNPGFQPFGFAGGIYDVDTKLTRYGARDYDAEVGRWTAKDPILFSGGDTNLYSYVIQDPVNFVDPSGYVGLVGSDVADAGYGVISGLGNFGKSYLDMMTSDTIGGDRYFHCMANCNSSSSSRAGSSFAKLLSDVREGYQNFDSKECSNDSEADQAANKIGRDAGVDGKNCQETCLRLVPGIKSRNRLLGR